MQQTFTKICETEVENCQHLVVVYLQNGKFGGTAMTVNSIWTCYCSTPVPWSGWHAKSWSPTAPIHSGAVAQEKSQFYDRNRIEGRWSNNCLVIACGGTANWHASPTSILSPCRRCLFESRIPILQPAIFNLWICIYRAQLPRQDRGAALERCRSPVRGCCNSRNEQSMTQCCGVISITTLRVGKSGTSDDCKWSGGAITCTLVWMTSRVPEWNPSVFYEGHRLHWIPSSLECSWNGINYFRRQIGIFSLIQSCSD